MAIRTNPCSEGVLCTWHSLGADLQSLVQLAAEHDHHDLGIAVLENIAVSRFAALQIIPGHLT